MASGLILPTDKSALVNAVYDMKNMARPACNHAKAKWLRILRYMQGDRNFSNVNFADGTISTVLPAIGDNNFKYEGMLPYYQTELGRMLQLDLRPAVTRKGRGLDGLQKASIGQIVLNDRMTEQQVDIFKMDLTTLFLQLGHVGVGAFVGPEGPHLEVIPAWELMHNPVIPAFSNNVECLLRVRWVTEEWLEENLSAKALKGADDGDFEWQKLPVGQSPADIHGAAQTKNMEAAPPYGQGKMGSRSAEKGKRTQKWTEFAECWVRTSGNRLRDYVAMAGKNIVEQQRELLSRSIHMPVNECRYLNAGGAYARGFAEQLVELNDQIEAMLDRLGMNVERLDINGTTVVSTQMGLDKMSVNEAKESGYMFYSPDLYTPDAKPFSLMPTTCGMMGPVRATQTFMEVMNAQAQQSEVLKGDAPGRVESAKALNLLFETANVPLGGPTSSLAAAVTASYVALLWLTKQEWGDRQAVELSLDDDALVGIIYDHKTGKVELKKDSIPDPDDINITVASKMPRSMAQLRADLDDQLEKQNITPIEYAIKVREAGIDLPVGYETEWQNHRSAKLNNIVLYGDGITPGSIIISTQGENEVIHAEEGQAQNVVMLFDNDMPEIHLKVVLAFMARPEFKMASKAVRDAFDKHLKVIQEASGTLPEGMQTPEDIGEQGGMSPLQISQYQQAM